MELLITILMLLGLRSTPDALNDPQFKKDNEVVITHGEKIIDGKLFHYDESGIVIIDEGVGG